MENLHAVVRYFYLIQLEKETGNKFRRIIGKQHDRWVELKEAFWVQTHAEVQASVLLLMQFGNWDMHN